MAILANAHLLRQFLAVVTEGTLTGAAEKVAVTQPALSKSIRKLERELGVPLFERLPRGIAIRAAGAGAAGSAWVVPPSGSAS